MNTKPDSALPSQPAGEREQFEAWRQGKGLTRPEEAWQAWQAARSSSPEGDPRH